MPPRLPLSVLVQVALSCALLLAGCARRPTSVAEPRLLAAVIDRDPSQSVEWSHTPQLAIYEDGRFIVRRDVEKLGHTSHSYWMGELETEELREVNRLIGAAAAISANDPRMDWREGWPQPETLLLFAGGGVGTLRLASPGRFAGPDGEDALELAPDLLRWLVYASELRSTSRPLSPWQPAAMRVRLVRMRPDASAGAWPAKWPAPEPASDSTGARREATVPVRSADVFWAVCGKDGAQTVTWDGKFWRAHLYPVIPGGEAWRDLVMPSGDEPSPSDSVVWFEVASLIAGADRVWLGRETEREPGAGWADREWVRHFAAAIEEAQLGRGTHCFCTGYRMARFERAGQPLVWVSAIHGDQLRIYAQKGGGDYKVSHATWQKVDELLTQAARDGIKRPQLPAELSGGGFSRNRPKLDAN